MFNINKISNIKNESYYKRYLSFIKDFNNKIDVINKGGGKASIQKQHDKF